jgi:transposase IS4-like protein
LALNIKVNINVNKHYISIKSLVISAFTMSANIIADPTDDGTLRPNEKPLPKAGTTFRPLKITPKEYKIHLPQGISPDDSFKLFQLYYTPDIISSIVEATNAYIREPEDPGLPYCRAHRFWDRPTCTSEIYIYLAIRIYMTIYVYNEISDYWSTSDIAPAHPISRHISRDRF